MRAVLSALVHGFFAVGMSYGELSVVQAVYVFGVMEFLLLSLFLGVEDAEEARPALRRLPEKGRYV